MAASNRYMNWSGVSLASTPITGIQELTFDEGISVKEEGADFDTGPTFSVVDWRNPVFTLRTIDAGAIIATASGVKGVFIAILRDLYNGVTATGGGKTFTTNALSYIGVRQINGQYREFANQSLTIKTTNIDGATNPVAVTSL